MSGVLVLFFVFLILELNILIQKRVNAVHGLKHFFMHADIVVKEKKKFSFTNISVVLVKCLEVSKITCRYCV